MATDNDTKPLDAFADLEGAYQALADLAHSELGGSSPVWILLCALNREFRRLLEVQDQAGNLT